MDSAIKNNGSQRRRLVRYLKRSVKWSLIAVLAYGFILLVGLIPVNTDFVSANEGVTIYIVSNAVHADVIVPKSHPAADWVSEFGNYQYQGEISAESHVAFGWGDRGFFLKTKTWDDLKLSVAANALLLPSASCMHVSFTRPEYYENAASVTISSQQYERLVVAIREKFKKNGDGKPVQIEGYAYSTTDAFFDAHGRYHLLNTCNSWIGSTLKSAGVCVPWLSPMPKTPTLYFGSK